MKLEIMEPVLSVIQFDAEEPIPEWALSSKWFSVTRTNEELSIVCCSSDIHSELGFKAEHGWRGIKVAGVLDFGLTRILSSLAAPLADQGISIFAISTFNTDYLLVKEDQLVKAKETLVKAGHDFQ